MYTAIIEALMHGTSLSFDVISTHAKLLSSSKTHLRIVVTKVGNDSKYVFSSVHYETMFGHTKLCNRNLHGRIPGTRFKFLFTCFLVDDISANDGGTEFSQLN